MPALANQPPLSGPLRFSLVERDQTSSQVFLVLKEAYRRLGIEVVAVELPAERSLQTAAAGMTDGEVARIAGLEKIYPDLVQVPEPLSMLEIKVFTTGLSFPVIGWESLRPYSFCYMHGFKAVEQATVGMKRTATATIQDLVRQLREGHCEVAVLGSRVWITVDRLNAGPLRELEPPLDVLPLYHYVHSRHAALIPDLAKELRKMRDEGLIDAILKPGQDALQMARKRQALP